MTEISPALGLSAYFLGRRIAGQRKRTPVAYLYNGVRLPKLPEWDREKYPYAWIAGLVGSDGSISYVLRTSSEPVTYKLYWLPEPDYYVYSVNGNGHIMPLENEEWQPFNMDTQHSNYFNVDRIASSWANHDIINTDDGTLYLAASDPVPVYE